MHRLIFVLPQAYRFILLCRVAAAAFRGLVMEVVATDILYSEAGDGSMVGIVQGGMVDFAVESITDEASNVSKDGGVYIRSGYHKRIIERKPAQPDAVLRIELHP